MLLSRSQPSLRTSFASAIRSGPQTTPQICLLDAFAALAVCTKTQPLRLSGVRYASHKAQGAVNKAKDGPGKRLGAKKSGEQYVIPGNIIFRQRGTHWFPGDNCGMGRDHTIYSKEHGFVKYYKDPDRHPKRQYIGVVFERDMVLPQPKHTVRRRRLGMTATPIASMHTSATVIAHEVGETIPEMDVRIDTPIFVGRAAQPSTNSEGVARTAGEVRKERKGEEGRQLTLRRGYMYRESNWEIGRAAERANVKVQAFKPGDRWAAWRKREARKAKGAEKRGLQGTKKKSK